MALTKNEIVDRIERINLTTSRQKSIKVVETLLEIIKNSLENDEDVMVSNFGKFSVKKKKERVGRNPATGETMMLRERRVVTFQYSTTLKDLINGNQRSLKS